MDNIFLGRHRNITVLGIVLAAQFLGLAVQIKRDQGSTPLIRTWAVAAITPIEKFLVHTTGAIHDTFANYFYLRNVRQENRQLKLDLDQARLQQIRLQEDAAQAHRLQSLLAFKEQFISETKAAQVIGTSGTDNSRVIYIDKGSADGVRDNMAVITPAGIVGKVAKAFHSTSQVLLISDQSWGAGAILTQSRLQGIVKGTQAGTVQLQYIMSDEQVKPGEPIVTSGGDRIFPKGLPVGTVREVSPGRENFLNIRVQPAADLTRLEEVLVITKIVEKAPDPNELSNAPIRASEILAERLPSVPQKPPEDLAKQSTTPVGSTPASTVVPAASKPATGTASAPPPNMAPATTPKTPNTKPVNPPKPSGESAAPQGH